MKKAFNSKLYLELQSKKILERIDFFGEKLYLEFGGKLFDDYHASRVLPGFSQDLKLQMLVSIKDMLEILIVINAKDIISNKIRNDLKITYESEVLRLIDAYKENGLLVGSVVISQYEDNVLVNQFIKKLKNLKIQTAKHYSIPSYPYNTPLILSEEGFGKNDFIKTTKPLIVVTAPGPGSGKLACSLSQLYHEHKRGIKAGYAKYETFPVWNLALRHPLNLAYEAATADLNDVNMIDPFHLEKYGTLAVNYNRDIEVFPVVKTIMDSIYGNSPYNSPTDMGVNMAGFAIEDEQKVIYSAKQEIIRRYLDTICDYRNAKASIEAVDKVAMLLSQLGLSVEMRRCVKPALEKATLTKTPSIALMLASGEIITAKTTELLSAPAALIINALKYLANINDEILLLAPQVIEPIGKLKVNSLGFSNPVLDTHEVLIALAVSDAFNPVVSLALKQLEKLKGTEAHSSVILGSTDVFIFKKLGINLTTEAVYPDQKLYRG